MISEKQLAANRRNALHSTGPRSPEGKARVRLNGLRHGLAGQTTVLSAEDRAAYETFCAGIVDCFQPATPLERQLAESIAGEYWRLNRISALETNIFSLGVFESGALESTGDNGTADPGVDAAFAAARAFCTDTGSFALLSIYEQRIVRAVSRNVRELRQMQAERQSCQAAQNGFGFANREKEPKPAAASA